MDSLIERLRRECPHTHAGDAETMVEAATALESKDALILRMREALEPFAAIRVHKSEEGNADALIGVKVSAIRKAREAVAAADKL